MSIPGIDIASWQGTPDFDQVARAGYVFGVSKATEWAATNPYVNPQHARNWREMLRVGMIRGAYCYLKPQLGFIQLQLDHFLANCGEFLPGDFCWLDVEEGSGDVSGPTLQWLQGFEAAQGFKPVLYSGDWFMAPHGLHNPALAPYGLALAAYQATAPSPPTPWPVLAFWQHSETGQVPGIAGNCDLDLFNGTREQLLLYGKPAPDPVQELTNNDIVQIERLLLEQPANVAGAISYLTPFTGGPHANAATLQPRRGRRTALPVHSAAATAGPVESP